MRKIFLAATPLLLLLACSKGEKAKESSSENPAPTVSPVAPLSSESTQRTFSCSRRQAAMEVKIIGDDEVLVTQRGKSCVLKEDPSLRQEEERFFQVDGTYDDVEGLSLLNLPQLVSSNGYGMFVAKGEKDCVEALGASFMKLYIRDQIVNSKAEPERRNVIYVARTKEGWPHLVMAHCQDAQK